MKQAFLSSLLLLGLLCLLHGIAMAGSRSSSRRSDETDLQRSFETFMLGLDALKMATDYPKAVKDLLSQVRERQTKALRIFGETGDPDAIPWLIPFLDAEDPYIRILAANALAEVVSAWALQRRDGKHPEKVVLLPRKAGSRDLRPLAWIVLKLFRKPDDGNTHASAATLARYLELPEFVGELRGCLRSRHPAVVTKAKWALESLDLPAFEGSPRD